MKTNENPVLKHALKLLTCRIRRRAVSPYALKSGISDMSEPAFVAEIFIFGASHRRTNVVGQHSVSLPNTADSSTRRMVA